MKISFKNKLHNCDKHLVKHHWREEGYIVETEEYCSICGRIKNHDAYGDNFVIKYKPKRFMRCFEIRCKGCKVEDLKNE